MPIWIQKFRHVFFGRGNKRNFDSKHGTWVECKWFKLKKSTVVSSCSCHSASSSQSWRTERNIYHKGATFWCGDHQQSHVDRKKDFTEISSGSIFSHKIKAFTLLSCHEKKKEMKKRFTSFCNRWSHRYFRYTRVYRLM